MDETAARVGVSDMSPLNASDTRCCPAKGFWQFLTSSCSFCLVACRWKECESRVWRERAGAGRWRRCYKKALPLEVLHPQQRLSELEKDAQKGEENQTAHLWWQIGGCGVSVCRQTRPWWWARTYLFLSRRIPLAWQQGEVARPQDLRGGAWTCVKTAWPWGFADLGKPRRFLLALHAFLLVSTRLVEPRFLYLCPVLWSW